MVQKFPNGSGLQILSTKDFSTSNFEVQKNQSDVFENLMINFYTEKYINKMKNMKP